MNLKAEEQAQENEIILKANLEFEEMNKRFDEVEAAMEKEIGAKKDPGYPLNHYFTPGLYLREIFLPKGNLLTSKIHLTEHPFIVSSGKAIVWSPDQGTVIVEAPYVGVTKPGTRRIIFALEDTTWLTCHATEETDLNVLEEKIIMQRANNLLTQ